jgi:hypothetical protein
MARVLTWEKEQAAFCCGLEEIGEFRVDNSEYMSEYANDPGNELDWPPDSSDKAYFATTLRTQTGSMKRLKKMGFKKLGSWTRDTGSKLILWGYFPRKRKKRR